jgi:hypothetical protein
MLHTSHTRTSNWIDLDCGQFRQKIEQLSQRVSAEAQVQIRL